MSLKPKKPAPNNKLKTKSKLDRDTRPPQQTRTPEKTGEDNRYGTTLKSIATVNRALGITLSPDQMPSHAVDAIERMASEGLTVEAEPKSEVLRRVLKFIESRIDGQPTWRKCFIMGGTECVWIAARALVLGFKSAEDVLDGLAERRYTKVAVGIIGVVVPIQEITVDHISWILSEATTRVATRKDPRRNKQ